MKLCLLFCNLVPSTGDCSASFIEISSYPGFFGEIQAYAKAGNVFCVQETSFEGHQGVFHLQSSSKEGIIPCNFDELKRIVTGSSRRCDQSKSVFKIRVCERIAFCRTGFCSILYPNRFRNEPEPMNSEGTENRIWMKNISKICCSRSAAVR